MIKQELVKEFNEWKEKNNDPYGGCCVAVAEQVMKDFNADTKIDPHKMINDADDKIGAGGITGYMAGVVASAVSYFDIRGDEFKKEWNRGYGVPETEKGIVNPAIVTITAK